LRAASAIFCSLENEKSFLRIFSRSVLITRSLENIVIGYEIQSYSTTGGNKKIIKKQQHKTPMERVVSETEKKEQMSISKLKTMLISFFLI
jgi:hypothetical protein